MEFLAMLYTVLLVAICLMMALLLFRSGRPTGGLDEVKSNLNINYSFYGLRAQR